jgi:hypothetical protein
MCGLFSFAGYFKKCPFQPEPESQYEAPDPDQKPRNGLKAKGMPDGIANYPYYDTSEAEKAE